VAALLIVAGIVLGLIAVVVVVVPLLVQQGAAFIASIPGHFKRLQELFIEPNVAWLEWLGVGDKGKTMADVVGQASSWLMNFAYRCGLGGAGLGRVGADRDAGSSRALSGSATGTACSRS
jgi:predicted PurR-regulated permease PerM